MLDLINDKWLKIANPAAVFLGFACVATSQDASVAPTNASTKVTYEQVQGIFKQHCVSCHNEDQPRAELVMTSIDGILAGSSSGPVVLAGDPAASPLYLLAAHLESPAMPPNKPKIPQRELNKIRDWIATELEEFKEAPDSKPMDAKPMDAKPTGSKNLDPNGSVLAPLQDVSQYHRAAHLACSPDGKRVAIEGNSQIVFWDTQSQKVDLQAIRVDDSHISGIKYSGDGKHLWCAVGKPGESGQLLRWSLQTQSFDMRLADESDTIQDFSVTRSGATVSIGTSSKLVKEIRGDQTVANEFKKHTDWVTRTAYSPDELILASGDRFGAVLLWDLLGHQEFASLRGHSTMITSLAWHDNKDLLLSSDLSGSVRVWDLHRLDSVENWVADPSGVVLAQWIDSDSVLTVGKDTGCQVWNLPVGNEKPKLLWHTPLDYPILAADLCANRRELVISGWQGQVELLTISKSDGVLARTPIELPKGRSPRSLVTFLPRSPDRATKVGRIANQEPDPIDQAIQSTERSLLSARQTVKEIEGQLSLLRQIKQSQQMKKKSP